MYIGSRPKSIKEEEASAEPFRPLNIPENYAGNAFSAPTEELSAEKEESRTTPALAFNEEKDEKKHPFAFTKLFPQIEKLFSSDALLILLALLLFGSEEGGELSLLLLLLLLF